MSPTKKKTKNLTRAHIGKTIPRTSDEVKEKWGQRLMRLETDEVSEQRVSEGIETLMMVERGVIINDGWKWELTDKNW